MVWYGIIGSVLLSGLNVVQRVFLKGVFLNLKDGRGSRVGRVWSLELEGGEKRDTDSSFPSLCFLSFSFSVLRWISPFSAESNDQFP